MMAPFRKAKKRKKTDRKTEDNASASASTKNEGSLDWWVELPNRINGIQNLSKGVDTFRTVFKISREMFNYVCSLVKEEWAAKPREFKFLNGNALSLHDQVAVALRRLGSGDSLVTVADAFGVNHSVVAQVAWRFVEAMEEIGLDHLKWPSESDLTKVKSKFKQMHGFPNCCGVVDTTRITMLLSSSDSAGNVWLDHEKNHSMVLQAVIDPEMKFRDIVTGWPGKLEDSVVFRSSNFYKLCEKGERLNGKNVQLSDGSEIREYIIGDAGYPLLPYLIVPYEGKELSKSEAEFNKKHSATHVVAQRAFTRLKESWGIISGFMWRPDRHKLPRIILVCCLLHNIAIDFDNEEQDYVSSAHWCEPSYRQQVCKSVDPKGTLRDKLACYLSGMMPP